MYQGTPAVSEDTWVMARGMEGCSKLADVAIRPPGI